MRREDDIVQALQRTGEGLAALRRLVREDIQRRARDRARLDRALERFEIHHTPACVVDQVCAGFHHPDLICADQSSCGFRVRHMQRHDIALTQHLLERIRGRCIPERQLVDRVEEQDSHPHRFREDRDLRPDVPVPDDPEGFAADLVSARRALEPLALVCRVAPRRELSVQRDDLRDRQFRDRSCVAERRVEDRDPAFRGRVQVHLVRPGAEASDREQTLAGFDDFAGELGLGTHANDMGPADRVDQRFALECALVRGDIEPLVREQARARLVRPFEEHDLDLRFGERGFHLCLGCRITHRGSPRGCHWVRGRVRRCSPCPSRSNHQGRRQAPNGSTRRAPGRAY